MAANDDKLKEKVKAQLKQKAGTKKTTTSANKASSSDMDDKAGVEAAATVSPIVQTPGRFTNRMAQKEDVAMFFRELAILIESGYPLMRALTMLGNKTSNRNLGGVIEQVASQVERGSTLAKALAPFPWYFSEVVVSMIEAGESSGAVMDSLNNIADDFEADEDLSEKITQALSYPILTSAVALLVFLVILLFVVPTFEDVYNRYDMNLPTSTAMLMWLSHILTDFWWLWIPVVALVGYAIKKRIGENMHYFDGMLLKIPVIGEIIILGSMARFSSSLRSLLENGVPIMQSLELSKGAAKNSIIINVIARMRDNVEAGKSLVQPMAEAGFFPPIVVDMLFVGEESGKLPFVLGQVTKHLRLHLDRITSRLSITLGPIMTLVVGLLVLFIALSLFIPYFDFLSSLPEIH